MLRLRIDLSAFDAKAQGTFWRLERDGILHETVLKYATFLLHEYGITGVNPLTFLDGTFLPDSESPLIIRDGDLLRILPGKFLETRPPTSNGHENEDAGDGQQQEAGTTVSVGSMSLEDIRSHQTSEMSGRRLPISEPADGTHELDVDDTSETAEHIQRKRKRGKRGSRVRSKRVSFDVLANENGRVNSLQQMESTPFRRKTTADSIEDTQNSSSVDTRSEAYMTALDATPGISRLSRTPMKTNTPRKNKKLQSGVGYYLSLLGSGDSSVIAQSSGTSDATPASNHLSPGPSTHEKSQSEQEEISLTVSERSMRETSLLSTLEPNLRISCDIGMFNVKTSAVEFHPDVTLEIVENNPKKKCLIVRHIEGPLPTSATEAEFKVDWGMLSSVKKL